MTIIEKQIKLNSSNFHLSRYPGHREESLILKKDN